MQVITTQTLSRPDRVLIKIFRSINSSIADASTTAQYSWLDSEFDNDAAGTATQTITLGIGAGASVGFPFIARSTARRQGATFSATSSSGFSTNVSTTVQCSVACIADAAYSVWGQTDMIAANITQTHFHWRNNNGSETSATAAALEDASTTVATGTVIRLRISINNAGDASSSAAFRLEYQKNATSGAWTQVTTSSVGSAEWQMATSSVVGDGSSTTNIATSTGGTTDPNIFFLAGEVVASTSRNQTVNTVLTGTQFSEMEFALKATAIASTSANYFFRVTNAGVAITTYSVYPLLIPVATVPTVTGVVLNGAGNITLSPNATATISVAASTTDPGGAANISFATSTIFRTSLGRGCAANNLNCYQIASTSCAFSGSTSTVTCSAQIYYFAQSTGNASATFPSDSWTGSITVTNLSGGNTTASSSAVNVNVLTAINITTSTLNYGTINASSTTGATNQTTTVQNAGNSSTTLQLSGTALVKGSSIISTSSQVYSTSSFTYPGTSTALTGSGVAVSGFLLTTATTTTAVSTPLFWGLSIPAGNGTGTYTGTVTFTSIFSP